MYDFLLIEKKEIFSSQKSFLNLKDKKISLLMPPPNITGKLHLGHAYECILQDFIVRFNFLKGFLTNWILGLDHAGISTQRCIDSLNISDKKEKKIEYVYSQWLPLIRGYFFEQWKKMGILSDFSNISFTLDEIRQREVKKVFISFYNDGLIVRDYRIVNWDKKLESVISDIEVETREHISNLYYLKYFIKDTEEYVLVATSRPETIFGDVAIFVNPNDQRNKWLIGKEVVNPHKKVVPVMFDECVDINFGSGVLKCSPGHDSVDYYLAKKYSLPLISCCDEKGVLNHLSGEWEGKKIWEIREKLIEILLEKKNCVKVEEYNSKKNFSSQSGVEIEPLLSRQWFLDLPKMIEIIEEKTPNFLDYVSFFPQVFSNRIKKWKLKIEKWCISRQLWWGHNIPAWYNEETDELFVGEDLCSCDPIVHRFGCKYSKWKKEGDVLDTWFSSSLWPIISSMTEKSSSVENYPITLLVTGYDILFFWVLRMIVLCFYLTKKTPFFNVVLHGLIRDNSGKKMSKSFGNGIYPEEVANKYGYDSLRLFFCSNVRWGIDINYNEDKLKSKWRFCQKLWSVGDFICSKVFSSKDSTFRLKKISKNEIWK